MENLKYFVYARRSSEDSTERQALSIPSQNKEIKEKFGNLKIVDWIDESHSAHRRGRPIFNEMIKRIENGEANGIIAWHPDRLSRNAYDAGVLINLLDEDSVLDYKFVSYHFENTAQGKKQLANAFTDSKHFSDKLSDDVQRGNREKLDRGELPGCAPIGYKNTMFSDRGLNKILVDEERFESVRKLWDLMLTGKYTAAEIERIADKEYKIRTMTRRRRGGTPLSKTGLLNMFRNPFYAGMIKRKGEYHQGTHKPMVTMKEFDDVQIILGKHGQPRPKIYKFPYTGMMTCGICGCAITAEYKKKRLKDGSLKIHTYYHCTHQNRNIACKQRSISAEEIENYYLEALDGFQIPDEYIEWGMEYLNELNDSEIKNRSIRIKNIQEEYKNVVSFLDRLTQGYCKGIIAEDLFEKQQTEYLNQRAELETILKEYNADADNTNEATREMFDYLKQAKYWFENGDEEVKKLTVLQFASNLILEDKKITIEADKLFSALIKGLDKMKKEAISIEPEIVGSYSHKLPVLAGVKNLWQGLEESDL